MNTTGPFEIPGTSRRAEPPAGISLACPHCRYPVTGCPPACARCARIFRVHDGVPVFLDDEEWRVMLAGLAAAKPVLEDYSRVRRTCDLTRTYFDMWVSRLLAEVPRDGGPVVELMCGEAEVCRRLPPWVRSAVALDSNVEFVANAARDLAVDGRTTVVCGDAARLPLESRSASCVVIMGGLHHARPVLSRVLGEVARVLRPGGVLVASEPANDNRLIRAIRHWQYARSSHQGHDAGEDGFTRAEVGKALAAHGLRLSKYEVFGFVAYPLMGNTDLLPLIEHVRSRALGRALLWLDSVLERSPLVKRLGWASLFTARLEAAA